MGVFAAAPLLWASLAGAAASTIGNMNAAQKKEDQARDDALYAKDEAQQQAQQIAIQTRKQVAAARAATAGSGTFLDDFAAINTDEIENFGALDEQMTLLTGQRRSTAITNSAAGSVRAATMNGFGDLLKAGYSGWKGTQGGAKS